MNELVYPLEQGNDLEQPKIFPLLSGGIDSSIATYIALGKNIGEIFPIFIDRGHSIGIHLAYPKEKIAIENLAKILSIKEHIEIEVPFTWYARYKMLSPDAFPYGRNLVLIAVAVARVVTLRSNSANIIVVGFTKSDVGDTSLDFVKSFNNTLRFTFENNEDNKIVQVWAPLIRLRKSEVLRFAYDRGLEGIIKNSWSCYRNGKVHCGECVGCLIRKTAFEEADIEDPTEYFSKSS
jgi:7-cyano-7-deazaguanine synthase